MKASSFITKETALLESMMSGTDDDTRRYLKNMHESFVVPYNAYLTKLSRRIDEAQLTADQITKLFGAIAGGPGQAGGTVLPDAVKQKFDAALPAPDAGPVKGFEQKAAQAAAQVQDPAAKQGIMDLIKKGLQNPVAQKLILTGISGVAGVAASALTGGLGGALGAGAAGAITGGLMGVINAKMQGADWKSAGIAGLKGAGMGGLAGAVGGLATQAARDVFGGASAPAEQPQQTSQSQSGMNIAGEPVVPGQPLSDTQMAVMKMAMDSGNTYPPEVMAQYNAQQTQDKFGSDFKLPVDSQISNRNVDNANADAWRAADDAGKKDIEQWVGKTADQLKNQNTGSGPGSSDFAKQDSRRTDTDTAQQPSGASDNPNAGKVRANLDQWRQQTGSPNAPQAANLTKDFDPSKIPDGWTMKQGATPVAGPADQGVDLGTPTDYTDTETPPINRLTGKPVSSGPTWDEMTPDQQAATIAKQQQQRQDAEQGTKNAQDYWKNKPANTRSLKASKEPTRPMLENVDRDLTIRMWALNESLGKSRGGVYVTEAGIGDLISKIGNFFKGGGASKGKTAEQLQAAWEQAGSPMDSEQVAAFLKKQGIADDIIANAYKQAGIPAPGEKIEPSMGVEPGTPAEPAQAPAAPAEPAQAAAPAQQAAQQPTSTGTVFDNPEQLAKDFEEYMAAGGKISPQFRGAIKAALQTGFKVVESKQRKLLKVLKEARRIDTELKKIKKQKL